MQNWVARATEFGQVSDVEVFRLSVWIGSGLGLRRQGVEESQPIGLVQIVGEAAALTLHS
jgi:hypothetical protein